MYKELLIKFFEVYQPDIVPQITESKIEDLLSLIGHQEKIFSEEERHQLGIHYTPESEILLVVDPCLVQPWQEKIDETETLNGLYDLLTEMTTYTVLDPSCGSGNFLFVAFRELKLLGKQILTKIRDFGKQAKEDKFRLQKFLETYPFVKTQQFFGYDINSLATKLSKLTLMVAKEIAYFDLAETLDSKEQPLPLDNLDNNILCIDALLNDDGTVRNWGTFSVIMGNPPFQSKNKMQDEFGREYVEKLRKAYPEVSGQADYCVHWFRQAIDYVKDNGFAGLIGTNTIRESFSRQSGLDYVIANGGNIISAVSSKKWTGEAAVSISIVAWKKGEFDGIKQLYIANPKTQKLKAYEVNFISGSLSMNTDVSNAKKLKINTENKSCFQGITHGYDNFLLPIEEGQKLIAKNIKNKLYLKPYLIGNELVGNLNSQPKRFAIDFSDLDDLLAVKKIKDLHTILDTNLYPKVVEKAEKELNETQKRGSRQRHLDNWWQFWCTRQGMKKAIKPLKKYIACSRVMLRPIFAFVDTAILANDKIIVFAFEDDYTFGIINSAIHWAWVQAKATTLEERFNYNSIIWDTFPFPQNITLKQVREIAFLSRELYQTRQKLIDEHNFSLGTIYRTIEKQPKHPINLLHKKLNKLVAKAYGFSEKLDILQQLLDLNLDIATKEGAGETVQGAGLPNFLTESEKAEFITEDCIRFLG